MNAFKTYRHRTWLKILSVFLLGILGTKANAQITTSDCANTYSYCTLDTVKLVPSDIVTYTNFVWYGGGVVTGANEITAGNAASFNVDPNRLGSNTIYVSAPGGTYILTSEYATPSGCATKNDTLIIQYLPIPDLVTTADTICASAGQSADLATLVTDDNGTAGPTPVWYPTLADAQAGTNALSSTVVAPTATTKYYVRKNTTAQDAENAPCYDIDSVTIDVRCLNLGNFVWYDTNNNGSYDVGEAPIAGLTVDLFYDANGNGVIDPSEQTPYSTVMTDVNGLYLFENLPPGDYFVGIPPSEFGSGGHLEYLYSSGTTMGNTGITSESDAADPDLVNANDDDNGMTVKSGTFYLGGVLTNGSIHLAYQTEPTGETPDNSTIDDADDNLTVGFSFYSMSLGGTLIADVNNNGILDGTESPLANVTVILYAGDGVTQLATTTTDANGNYVFNNLPEGNYYVGVDMDDPDMDGYHSADDISTTGTPESNDGDDNGIGTGGTGIILTGVITLDAGTEPTGDGGLAGNPLTPDSNTNNYIDFGVVPDCPTITNPAGAQTICATESGADLSVDASLTAGDISFIRFTSAQTGNAMYTGGTQVGSDVTPASGTATYTFNTADFPNTGTSVITYYVYGIMATPSADPTCRPFQEIQVVVNPKPTATNASITECENALGSGEGDFTLTDANATVLGSQTGMTVTYHATLADAQAGTPDLTSGYAAPSGTIYVRVENAQGCYATATITLNVNPKPDFTLALATVCPGDNPEVNISNLLNGDALLSNTSVNGGTFNPYDASPPSITTADGLLLNATNTITVRNEFGCETDKTIVVPDITPLVCPPVNVTVKRAGE